MASKGSVVQIIEEVFMSIVFQRKLGNWEFWLLKDYSIKTFFFYHLYMRKLELVRKRINSQDHCKIIRKTWRFQSFESLSHEKKWKKCQKGILIKVYSSFLVLILGLLLRWGLRSSPHYSLILNSSSDSVSQVLRLLIWALMPHSYS